MTVSIHKLTPPQISALREALPNCVEAGILTTTASIATFHDRPALPGPWRRENVVKLLTSLREPYDTPLAKVLRKLHQRPDLVKEA